MNLSMELQKRPILKEIVEWLLCIVIALIIALVVKEYIGTFTTVHHYSMYPTLNEKDKLWLDRTIRTFNGKYNRFDIVTCEAPSSDNIFVSNNSPIASYNNSFKNAIEKFKYNFLELNKKSYIKRIIGLPGDYIEIEKGKVFVNGELLDEKYVKGINITNSYNLNKFVVPEGTYFLMGDNRLNSLDSRAFGCVPKEKLEGRVLFRISPFNKIGKIYK